MVKATNTINLRSRSLQQTVRHTGFQDKETAMRAADSWLNDEFSHTIRDVMPGAARAVED